MAGNTFYLTICHMGGVQKFRIIVALQEIGLPVAVNAHLDRNGSITFNDIDVAGTTILIRINYGSVIISEIASFSQEYFRRVACLAIIHFGGNFSVLQVAKEASFFGDENMLTLNHLRVTTGAPQLFTAAEFAQVIAMVKIHIFKFERTKELLVKVASGAETGLIRNLCPGLGFFICQRDIFSQLKETRHFAANCTRYAWLEVAVGTRNVAMS